ncbi:hypothetical protein Q1695_004357 [Nippostrongylus brasiliensis]|nr:hypothetical protein Q1695_004357 [Nippostrongylus brasiliensis]
MSLVPNPLLQEKRFKCSLSKNEYSKRTLTMVNLQQHLVLAVLLHISIDRITAGRKGAAFSQEATGDKCTWKNKSNFCQFVKRAQGFSRDALKRLNGDLAGVGKKKLSEAYELVVAVVNNKSRASNELTIAFNVEAIALFLVGKDCSNLYQTLHNQTERQEGLSETCRDVSYNIKSAMLNILYAIIETQTDQRMREATREALERFEHVLTPW